MDKETEKGRLPSLRSCLNLEDWLKSRGPSVTCHRDSSPLLWGAECAESPVLLLLSWVLVRCCCPSSCCLRAGPKELLSQG